MLEDPYEYAEQERKHERAYVRRIMLAILLGGFVAACAVAFVKNASAEPMFSSTSDGITITLTDEPCALKEIGNLPYRATWTEKGKSFEGCWAPHQGAGVVISYWEDRTIAVIPIQEFRRVLGA